ncbi:helix-turn-helix transcriptional regulator [Sphingobium sp. D43FB]|uniref:helix-turn-helix domain-containing protein n=1 Tax=Sphingobium sp. D43FB TaxID=2017595 RepID=UPI000BB58C61|nr:helix-turn-helix transcriptional regulator [Sphingobium sp. D43FB]
MSIGQRFFEIRRMQKATQMQFAGQLGLSQSALVAYERGERDPPAAAIAKLCEVHKVDPTWLLSGTGIPFRDSLVEMMGKALVLAKDFVLKYETRPSRESELRLAKLYFQYLIENGTISNDMADLLAQRRVVNE